MKKTVVQRLMQLFHGLDRAYGEYVLMQRPAGGQKVPGKARTVPEPVTEEIWSGHLEGKRGIGIVPINDESKCWFGAIDIDVYTININEVERACATLGLPLVPTRTKSGGVHLYLFVRDAAIAAKLIKSRLEEFAVALGYGGAEIFPKQEFLLHKDDTGNWINMPYFGCLTGKTERYAIFAGKELNVEEFCARAEKLRVTEEQLVSIKFKPPEEFLEGPPCLQSLATSGFTPGVRNNGLFAVGTYLKKRYPDDWVSHVQSYNVKFFKPPVGDAEVKTILKSLARKDYNYACNKAPISNFCNRPLCRTRQFGIGKDAADWNIIFDTADAVKLLTDPPVWIITVNGQRLHLTTQDWTSQKAFCDRCVAVLNYYPGKLPDDKWRAEVNRILQVARDTAVAPDASATGELEYYLQQFCTVHAQAETREEILTGKPFTEDGYVYFRSADFKRYLEAQHFRALTTTRLYTHLRSKGLDDKQMRIGEQNQRVWFIKAWDSHHVDIPARKPKDEGEM